MIAFILLVIGGLNWGLVGIGGFMGSNWNVVHLIFGTWPVVEWIIYILVGIATIYELIVHKKNCKMCAGGAMK